MQTQELEAQIKAKTGRSPSGVECEFIDLENGYGLKLFPSKFKRDLVFHNQELCAEYDLGPEVGERVDFPSMNRWGYITEKVETLFDNSSTYQKMRAWETAHADETLRILDKIENVTGICFEDDHCKNWGKRADGSLVWIDFGTGMS